LTGIVEQQQPRDVEPQEYHDGQQYCLDAQDGRPPGEGQRADQGERGDPRSADIRSCNGDRRAALGSPLPGPSWVAVTPPCCVGRAGGGRRVTRTGAARARQAAARSRSTAFAG
jgi:hypothetical protein